jgi:octanoyl-[GcvH]:protein N-octanoyltransferase
MPKPCSGSLTDADFLEGSAGADAALDVALPHALVGLIGEGRRPGVVRCYRPAPTVAFGRRDAFLAGFPGAAAAARRHGFTPVIRGAGGRAAAYHDQCLIFDEIMPSHESTGGIRERFEEEAHRQAAALRTLGVDARVGEVPGEYCPGEFSVNAGGRVKLIGAAQRIVRGAWLLSSVVVVDSSIEIRIVLTDVYAELGLEWDPATAGAIADVAPSVGVDQVQRALLALYSTRYALSPATVDELTLARATELLERHRVDR